MAVTWSTFVADAPANQRVASNGKRGKIAILSPTGTYTTGGDSLTAVMAALGLKGITALYQGQQGGTNAVGLSFELAGTTEAPLLKAYVAATGGAGASAEVAGGTTLTGKLFTTYIEGY
jgi:hypothetical protein